MALEPTQEPKDVGDGIHMQLGYEVAIGLYAEAELGSLGLESDIDAQAKHGGVGQSAGTGWMYDVVYFRSD